MSAAEDLAAILASQDGTPIETGGATPILEAIAGEDIRAEVYNVAVRELRADEARLLLPGRATTVVTRLGLLRTASGMPVAEVTAVLLPRRVPGPARPVLGLHQSTGKPLASGRRSVPLGRALRGHGVLREHVRVTLTPGRTDAAGAAQALYSVARLTQAGRPVALVTECVYEEFLAACTVPQSLLPAGRPPAAARQAGATGAPATAA